MIRRRAKAAGIQTKIGNDTFRATGITTYLKNGGKLEMLSRSRGMSLRAPRGCTIGATMT
jgi:hypothetical protein